MDNLYAQDSNAAGRATVALLGGNTAYKREALVKFGNFDEALRYGAAETELNDRIINGAGKLYFVRELSTLHSPQKHSLFTYFLESFKQGEGKAYSLKKNGRPMIKLCGRRRMWFYRIASGLNVNLPDRIFSALFLILNSICYRAGLFLGKLRYACG